MLEVRNLTVRYGDQTVVNDVSFSVGAGEWLMIAGPNGAGKSTVINALSQGAPYTGNVLLNGADIKKRRAGDLARDMGVLTQNHFVGYSFTVEEVVSLGRYAYARSPFAPKSAEDVKSVEAALDITGMTVLRGQSVLTLSGGELQRAFLAQVFAQNPKLLLLDEPTNHLDLQYQKQVFSLIQEWLKTPGRAVVCVVHDLSLARAYGTRALLMSGGKTLAQGDVQTVLSRENLEKAYDMDVFAWMQSMLSQWKHG